MAICRCVSCSEASCNVTLWAYRECDYALAAELYGRFCIGRENAMKVWAALDDWEQGDWLSVATHVNATYRGI